MTHDTKNSQQVVLVTGAGSGIGRAIALSLARAGHQVYASMREIRQKNRERVVGPYIASKVAGDAIAEIMGMEVRPVGIESVILVPGAFTSGTEHFAHSNAPEYLAIEQQYGDLPDRTASLGDRLNAIDVANGGGLDVSAVGQAAVEVLAMPRGERPSRIVIDGQRKGTEAIDAVYHEKQVAFLRQMGLEDLAPPAPRQMP